MRRQDEGVAMVTDVDELGLAGLDPKATVVVATGNAHKLDEIRAILAPIMGGMRFVALSELGDFPDPVEDGQTFLENALIKARAAQKGTELRDAGIMLELECLLPLFLRRRVLRDIFLKPRFGIRNHRLEFIA